jgi:hypothetical protein
MPRFAGFFASNLGIRSHEFGKRALQAPNATRHSIDFVAGSEVCNPYSNAFDDTGEINAQDGRQRMPGVRGLSLGYFQVQRINPARLDPDQHLSFGRRGAIDRAEKKR